MDKLSLWDDAIKCSATYQKLDKDLKVDVLIIGAGITGITSALRLLDENKTIALIDAHTVGHGTTGFSTGNLYIPVQNFCHTIKRKFGDRATQLIIDSRRMAIDFIESVIRKNNISCNFLRRPLYIFTTDPKKSKLIQRELIVLRKFGVAAEFVNELPINIKPCKAIKLENQARFNPYKYTTSVAANLAANGCQIFEHTTATEIETFGDNCIVRANGYTIKTNKVIIATHLPIGINHTQFLAYPYRSYAVAIKTKNSNYPNGNFWHIDSSYYATSTHNVFNENLDTLIVSGCHHKTGQLKNHNYQFQLIKEYLENNFEVAEIVKEWSAQHYRPADNLPYIGFAKPFNKNVYLATGFSADGLTYGTVAGILLADLILNKPNPWAAVYNSLRVKPLASFWQFCKENFNVILRYVADHLKRVEQIDVSNIQPGEGKLIEAEGKKYAVYCDEKNTKHIVSAVCPHMKCIVAWNNAEQTWDCPCHGSRFTIAGEVIEGPAVLPLEKYQK